jgi:cyclophilin family peptidyl-prolyl cis-trans isomerase
MHRPLYRRAVAVFLSAFLGWTTAAEGRERALQRPSGSPPPAQTPPTGAKPVQAPPLQPAPDTPAPGNPVVVMSTSLGDITIELFKTQAPVSVQNFLQYVNEGFYAGTVFHRVKKGFMIQGGGFTPSLQEKPTRPPILNEATNGLRNVRGTVAMARTRALRSATSQFYINVVDNRALDHTGESPADFGYAVFGRVLAGMDVVDRIVAVPTTSTASMDDVPIDPVVIKGMKVVK